MTVDQFASWKMQTGIESRTLFTNVYEEYRRLAKENGIDEPVSKKLFGMKMRQAGFILRRFTGGQIVFDGSCTKKYFDPNNEKLQTVSVRVVGDSYALTIPASFLEELNWKKGDSVIAEVVNGHLVYSTYHV